MINKRRVAITDTGRIRRTLVYKGTGPSTWAVPPVSRPDPVRSVSFRSFRFRPLLKADGAFQFRPRTVGSTGRTELILGPRCPRGPGRARGAVAGRGRQSGPYRGCAAGRTPIVKNGNLPLRYLPSDALCFSANRQPQIFPLTFPQLSPAQSATRISMNLRKTFHVCQPLSLQSVIR